MYAHGRDSISVWPFVCVCARAHACARACARACVVCVMCVYGCVYVCMFVRHVGIFVCMHACMYICRVTCSSMSEASMVDCFSLFTNASTDILLQAHRHTDTQTHRHTLAKNKYASSPHEVSTKWFVDNGAFLHSMLHPTATFKNYMCSRFCTARLFQLKTRTQHEVYGSTYICTDTKCWCLILLTSARPHTAHLGRVQVTLMSLFF